MEIYLQRMKHTHQSNTAVGACMEHNLRLLVLLPKVLLACKKCLKTARANRDSQNTFLPHQVVHTHTLQSKHFSINENNVLTSVSIFSLIFL